MATGIRDDLYFAIYPLAIVLVKQPIDVG